MTTISGKTDPVVQQISFGDIVEALIQGLRDFQAAPLYGMALGALYCVAGIAIVLSVTSLGMSYLAYPLAAGFALLGPFVAVGFYEISRRREAGRSASSGLAGVRPSPICTTASVVCRTRFFVASSRASVASVSEARTDWSAPFTRYPSRCSVCSTEPFFQSAFFTRLPTSCGSRLMT